VESLIHALESSPLQFGDYSLEAAVLSLLLAFVLGQVIAWTYVWTHSGLSYSRSYTQSLVMMTVVVSLVMFVIGNSIITAFGLLGALALIRFRNVLKDTRDTVFVFMALVVGMAVGTQRYLLAILGTVMLSAIVYYLNMTSFGTMGRYDGYLTLRVATGMGGAEFGDLLHRFCRTIKQVSTRQAGDEEGAEYVYQIGLRDRARGFEMIRELRELQGVIHVSLVVRDELSEV